MDSLIELMYKKRFGLSSISNLNKNNCCENTSFYHIACCFSGGRIISFGQNHFPPSTDHYKTPMSSIHAERDAVNKLPKIRKKKKVSMLVLRFTKTGNLTMSQPCNKCINNMCTLFPKKGYYVQDIYYSNYDGTIKHTNLSKLTKY